MRKSILLLLTLFAAWNASAQGTLEDYHRAYSLAERFSPDKVYYSNVRPSWIGGSHAFWYIRHSPEGDCYVRVDADRKSRKPLFDHARLANAIQRATGRETRPEALPLGYAHLSRQGDTLRFVLNGHWWNYAIRKNVLSDAGPIPPRGPERHWMEMDDEKEFGPVTSPDGRYEAFIRNHNVAVREVATGEVRELSQDGCEGGYYSAYIQWSPDSKYVASCRIRPAVKHYIYYVESSPADQLQPKLHKQEYAKPGDELPFRTPCLFEVKTGRAVIPTTELFDKQYDLHLTGWNKESRGITFEYNERGHQNYRILELSPEGEVRPIVEEHSETFVNYTRYFRHDTEDDKEIVWMSERDNYNHLYLYDKQRGEVINQITRGPWYVREVLDVDEKTRTILFTASGVNGDEDPYFIRYYRIGFDGSGMCCLTPAAGNHEAWFSEDGSLLVDVSSTVETAPVAVVRDATDGREIMELERADISALEAAGWRAPEVFTAKGRDGETDIWGIIVRPTNFDPEKRYPVIEYIYAGPGSHYVPKSFRSYDYNMTALAELGFIVVQLDGMGTSFRSKKFEDVCYKNLKDAGFPDRKLWIKAAAAKYPQMDIDRVGIFGASAGGQESTTAVLLHPDFYKAAYSACGCHDNRMDKIWWNEQWLGYPIGEQYREGSNVENAHLLTRPLMLVVGELDDNVDPASTMQVVDALIKANKDFELVVLPGVHHTMGEHYGEHKRYDFFVRNLLGVTPPSWQEVEAKTE